MIDRGPSLRNYFLSIPSIVPFIQPTNSSTPGLSLLSDCTLGFNMARKMPAKDQMVKLIVGAGQASPSPPVGPALGSKGVKSMDFCKVRKEPARMGMTRRKLTMLAGVQCANCSHCGWHPNPSTSHRPSRSFIHLRHPHSYNIMAVTSSCGSKRHQEQDQRRPESRQRDCWYSHTQACL